MKPNKNFKIKNILLIFLITIFLSACSITDNKSQLNSSEILENNSELVEIKSQEDLDNLIIKNKDSNTLLKTLIQPKIVQEANFLDSSSQTKSSNDYSLTNNQVQGVDEADIVKTDGNYIYTLSQNKIIVVKKEFNNSHTIIQEIKLKENSNIVNFIIKNNKIVIFSQEHITHFTIDQEKLLIQEIFSQVTSVSIYENINDKYDLITTYSIDGNYNDARLINNHIYLISNKYIYQNTHLPTIFKDSQPLTTSRTFILPHIPLEQFTIISTLNLEDLKEFNSNSYLIDYSSTVYISQSNIYLISNNYNSLINQNLEEFKQIIYPLIKDKTNINLDEEKEVIFKKFNNYFNSLTQKEKQDLYEKIQEKSEEFYLNQQKQQTSKIHKFSINNGEINFEKTNNVIGNLLNQFSLDEHENNLRVATTLSYWDRNSNEQFTENFVTIFDENLNQISQLDSIAIGERIFSARFEKEILYLVTFEQVDPFFVIDLSNPNQPKVLGELKLPGFSNYLQTYNSTHVIGIGRETKENDNRGFEITGLKISLFDVTDKLNPIEVSNFILEEKYAQSQSLYEHKSILLDSKKEILVIPIQQNNYWFSDEIENKNSFNGAFVFSLKNNQIKKELEIEHNFIKTQNYWAYPNQIIRSLYIEDNLYTISQAGILVYDLENLQIIDEINFNYKQEQYDIIEPYYR